MAFSRIQLRDDLLAKLGREDPSIATALEVSEVTRAVNTALQILWRAGTDYFLRQDIEVSLIAGQSRYAVSDTAQELTGPVRMANGQMLSRFENLGQMESYAMEFLGATSRTVANGTPWGFLVEHRRGIAGVQVVNASVAECNGTYYFDSENSWWQGVGAAANIQIRGDDSQYSFWSVSEEDSYFVSGARGEPTLPNRWAGLLSVTQWVGGNIGPDDTAAMPRLSAVGNDAHGMTIAIQPPPSTAAVTAGSPMTVSGILECPRYDEDDSLDTAASLPIPDGYVETLLLPLARRELMRSHLFSRKDLAQIYEADGQAALQMLGIANAKANATGDTGSEGKAPKAKRTS